MARHRAFTLIELVVVLMILSIVALFAAPRIGGGHLRGARLRSAAVRLAAVAEYARDQAVSQRRTHYFTVDARAGTYAYYAELLEDESGEAKRTVAPLPEGIRFEGVRTAENERAAASSVEFALTPEGWMDDGVVYLANEDDATYTVVFSSTTGRVETHKGRVNPFSRARRETTR